METLNFFAAAEGSPMGSQLIIMFLLLAGMWFLLIAPQKKRQKKHAAMIDALQTGDSVITSSGIYGTITNVKEDRFVLKIADNTRVEVARAFIQAKLDRVEQAS